MKKGQKLISWVLRIVIAMAFLMASSGKLMAQEGVVQLFEHWGYPDGFYWVIGAFELLLAILLLLPKTLKVALLGISLLMIGAMGTHLLKDPFIQVLRPLVFLMLTLVVYYLNFRVKKAPMEP